MPAAVNAILPDEVPDWASEAQIEDASGIIRNVLLCGNRSANGYEIPAKAFGDSANVSRLYNEKPVFTDHPAMESGNRPRDPRDRKVSDIAGVVKNARLENGRPRGDIHTADAPAGATLRMLAKTRMIGVGLSHVARHVYNSTKTIVESIAEVLSVDVVAYPATTRTFFEHQRSGDPAIMADQTPVELLTKQLADQRSEFDTKLAAITAERDTSKAAVADLTGKLTVITAERDTLTSKVSNFETQAAMVVRKQWIDAKLVEHKLDPADAVICSESFRTGLMSIADDAAREAVIKERSELVVGVATGKVKPGVISQERQGSPQLNGGKTDFKFEDQTASLSKHGISVFN